MLYDPNTRRYGSRYGPAIVLTQEQKKDIVESMTNKPMDRTELMEAIAEENPVSTPHNWEGWAKKLNDEEWKKLLSEVPNFTSPPMKRGCLRFMIGLQRSGKSTWATNWMRGKPRFEDGVIFPRAVVCADNIRLAVTGHRFNKHAEPVTFMVKDYMIEALLQRGHDVLIDGTHTTKTSIRRNFEIDIDAQWTLINTPKEVCEQRARDTFQPDLVHVLQRTGRQLAKLLDEGLPQVCDALREEVRARWGNNTVTEK